MSPNNSMLQRLIYCLIISLAFVSFASASVEIKSDVVHYLLESDKTLQLEQLKKHLLAGDMKSTALKNLTFGINSKPVWLHFQVENHSDIVSTQLLVTAVSWVDYIDLYFENSHKQLVVLNAGDRVDGAPYTVPGIGIAFDLEFTPGINNVYIRAETVDSIIFPISLIQQQEKLDRFSGTYLYYGLIYGFLFSLVLINLMFYQILGNRVYLYYSLAVASFVFINVGYTGHGIYWFWSGSAEIQNFAVLAFLVVYSVLFLSFGRSFLEIDSARPKVAKAIKVYQVLGLVVISLALFYNDQLLVGLVAYSYLAVSALILLALGFVFINQIKEGRYFFIALICGMAGVIISDLTVVGVLPYTRVYFHSAEIGVTLEAAILALALTKNMKMRELLRLKSEKLACVDPLTSLDNRRSFNQSIASIMPDILEQDKNLCVIMLDVDKFKSINDSYGHLIGDQALQLIAKRIKQQLRQNDMAVRWGGEEILLVLPDINIADASLLADRIRDSIGREPFSIDEINLTITISLGLAELNGQQDIDELIYDADQALLKAKQSGRNKAVVY
ncbi:MAG: sensor domain-containing diguanylate cyclase [Gammaproteobacteria bacterium]|nr:sensor domain-containing diguanylate cyclase [Gammaproteobacteria bacterium]